MTIFKLPSLSFGNNLQFQYAVEVQKCFSLLSVEELDAWDKFKDGIGVNFSAEKNQTA